MKDWPQIKTGKNNFAFIGEAGGGKSEIAINFARLLSERGDKPVHFFDLDMTKPLFRSRDLVSELAEMGVILHYEEQFMDAPTTTGGVSRVLRDDACYAVLDVGGDHIGARSIGGYAPLLNCQQDTAVYYVINSYRPWSADLEHIDRVMAETLGVSHIRPDNLRLVGNPNLGTGTTSADVIKGIMRLRETVKPYMGFEFFCVREQLCRQIKDHLACPILPIRLYLSYPWSGE